MTPMRNHRLRRRNFIKSTFVLTTAGLWLPEVARAAPSPNSNPLRSMSLAWTDKLRWDAVVDITTMARVGEFWDERLNQAQEVITAKGGGVVFFPAGKYLFREDIHLQSGVIL